MNRQILWVIILFLSLLLFSCSLDKNVTTPETPDDTTIPYSPTPPNGATNLDSYQRLSWKCTGATSFSIYFDRVTPPVKLIKSNTTEKFVDVIAGKDGVVYYWRVIAKSNGTTKEGPIWHFTTGANASTKPGYVLTTHYVTTEIPNIVKMLFQVTSLENKGISFLTINDFEISENGYDVSKFESNMNISKREENPYLVKTVLMLDNSTSIGDDANTLKLMKDAAKNFIDNMSKQQEVALYKFSSEPEKILDFTSDKDLLKTAINSIGGGFATTNLYGAVIEGVSQWEDFVSNDKIIQGSLVLFTDGNDTQGSSTLADALNAIGDKKVYTIGLGSEIERTILEQLGNQGAFSIAEINELNQIFLQIQQEIEDLSNSYYWMEYSSPKRGNNEHTLSLTVEDNPIYSVAEGTFSSAGFFDPTPGIYFNSSFANTMGDTLFTLTPGGYPVEINVFTFGKERTPYYNWSSDPSLTVDKLNSPKNSHVKIYANSNAPAGKVTLTIDDTENKLSRTISFNIIR